MAKPASLDLAARLSALDDEFQIFVATKPPAESIAAFEAELGFPLESGYRACVLSSGCAAAVAKAEVWPPPEPFEVRPQWQLERVVEFYGLATGPLPPELDVRVRTAALRERGLAGWVATVGVPGTQLTLAHDAAGDYAWIGGDGAIARVTATFEHVVGQRLAQLQSDKDRFVAERAKQAARHDAKRESAEAIAKALIESPWDGDELLDGATHATQDAVRALLLMALAAEPNAEVVAALSALPSPATTAALLTTLASAEDDDLLEAIAEALGACPGDESRAALVSLLDASAPNVIGAAVESLAVHADPRLAEHLFARLEPWAELGDDLLLYTAVGTLREQAASDPRLLPALVSLWDLALRHVGTLMASNAVYEALATLTQTPDAQHLVVTTFERAAASPDGYLQARGIGGLAAIGRDVERYLPRLIALLGDKRYAVQANAESAFLHLGERGGAVLRDLTKTAKGRTKSAAKRALALLAAAAHDDDEESEP